MADIPRVASLHCIFDRKLHRLVQFFLGEKVVPGKEVFGTGWEPAVNGLLDVTRPEAVTKMGRSTGTMVCGQLRRG